MNNLIHLLRPGGQVVHHIHYVGPSGANGTQQFPKLTDCELCCLLKPLIQESILCVYANQPTEAQSAQNMLAHLLDIVKSGLEIFKKNRKRTLLLQQRVHWRADACASSTQGDV